MFYKLFNSHGSGLRDQGDDHRRDFHDFLPLLDFHFQNPWLLKCLSDFFLFEFCRNFLSFKLLT